MEHQTRIVLIVVLLGCSIYWHCTITGEGCTISSMKTSHFFSKIPRNSLRRTPFKVLSAALPALLRPASAFERMSAFERELALAAGTRHAILTSSCRAAFDLLLEALRLNEDTEVLLAPVTHWEMVNAILRNRLRPVFIDFAEGSTSICPKAASEHISRRTKVLLATHLNGLPAPMSALAALARAHELQLIEDISYGLETWHAGKRLGTFGAASVMSMSMFKPLDTCRGGAIITDDDQLAQRIRRAMSLRQGPAAAAFMGSCASELMSQLLFSRAGFSLFTHYLFNGMERFKPGSVDELQRGNPRPLNPTDGHIRMCEAGSLRPPAHPSPGQALLGRPGLARLPERAARFRANAEAICELFAHFAPHRLPALEQGDVPAFWRLPVWMGDRPGFRAFMSDRYIDTSISGLPCCSELAAFKAFAMATPRASAYGRETVCIPNQDALSTSQLRLILDSLTEYFTL